MSTAELKVDLINHINSLSEEGQLEGIMQLVKFQSDVTIFETTAEDKWAIEDAKNQIVSGQSISHKELQNEIKQWLKG